MPTNKEKILQFIKEETSKNIQEQSYTFEKCNAQIISMELFLDRANVSRVLNEFHKSGKLIKKTGRPTTYISRDVLSAIFPFASFPEILNKEESITDYFSQEKASPEPSITRSFSIVGSGQGGSLYELIHQILPVFYLPQNFLKIIVLQGEAGTGKKYFLRKILERAKQLYTARPDSQIYFSDFHTISGCLYETLSNIEKNASLYILSIELPPSSAKEEIQQFLQSAELYYENQDNAPIFAFCIPNNFDVSVFYAMTSIVLKFPGLKERPQTEVIQIILNTIQQESLRLAKKISVSSRLIQSLASNSQNLHQLNQEILYAISKGVIASHRNGELHNIHLDSAYLSDFFKTLQDLQILTPSGISLISLLYRQILHLIFLKAGSLLTKHNFPKPPLRTFLISFFRTFCYVVLQNRQNRPVLIPMTDFTLRWNSFFIKLLSRPIPLYVTMYVPISYRY